MKRFCVIQNFNLSFVLNLLNDILNTFFRNFAKKSKPFFFTGISVYVNLHERRGLKENQIVSRTRSHLKGVLFHSSLPLCIIKARGGSRVKNFDFFKFLLVVNSSRGGSY